MKYTVTGFIPVKIEVEAMSEKEAIAEATSQFDLEEFASYNTPEPQFKKAVAEAEDEEEIDLDEDEEDEE